MPEGRLGLLAMAARQPDTDQWDQTNLDGRPQADCSTRIESMSYIDGNLQCKPVSESEPAGPEGSDGEILRAESVAKWHVLHVKSRQEKALCQDLSARGIRHYLPLFRQTRFYGHRKSEVQLPLFAGYVFLLGTMEQAYGADRTGRVARIIPVFNQDQMNWELTNLQVALHRSPSVRPYPFLKEGVRVEVRGGPFRGVQGVVEARARECRLILQVTTLGKAVSLEIDASLVDPVD